MTRYSGPQYEVRIATTESGLATASPIPYAPVVEWRNNRAIRNYWKGLGYWTSEPHAGPMDLTGQIRREYDETKVFGGTSTLSAGIGVFTVGDLPEFYVQVKNTVTGTITTLKKCKGQYTRSHPEGFCQETIDFWFEEVTEA